MLSLCRELTRRDVVDGSDSDDNVSYRCVVIVLWRCGKINFQPECVCELCCAHVSVCGSVFDSLSKSMMYEQHKTDQRNSECEPNAHFWFEVVGDVVDYDLLYCTYLWALGRPRNG